LCCCVVVLLCCCVVVLMCCCFVVLLCCFVVVLLCCCVVVVLCLQYPAVKHVGIGSSHIHDWRSAQSTSHPIPAMLTGDRELTRIYFGNRFIYHSLRYLKVYKMMATVS
jgi:hypothetical protein